MDEEIVLGGRGGITHPATYMCNPAYNLSEYWTICSTENNSDKNY